MSHAIERTSAFGGPFIGTCTKCGTPDLGMGDALEPCPADGLVSDEQALLEALAKPIGPSKRMDVAPKDGTFLWLLVDYTDGSHPLEDATQAWTIGFNCLETLGDDEWQFAGWDWCQDRFTEGRGVVIDWRPCPIPPLSAVLGAEGPKGGAV